MSIIPKIKVGRPSKREKLNLNFDCSTTANIGTLQPTMAREMVPNETFKVKVSSLVRLSSMPLPTFGRMSLRHYHCFVPYSALWEPFSAMLSGQHFTNNAGTSFIPTKTPYFNLRTLLLDFIMNYSDVSIAKKSDIQHPISVDPDAENPLTEAQDAFDALKAATVLFGATVGTRKFFDQGAGSEASDARGVINFGLVNAHVNVATDTTLSANTSLNPTGNCYYAPGNTVITVEGADLITDIGTSDYVLLVKFKPFLKRLRTIFIGLGYPFNPYVNDKQFSPFKLLAYYRAWFFMFRPNRELAYQDTNCYKLCRKLAESNGLNLDTVGLFKTFVGDLMTHCFYYLPMDYFSMATTSPQQPNSDTYYQIGTSYYLNGTVASTNKVISTGLNAGSESLGNVHIQGTTFDGTANPLMMKMAMQLLRFANKNTIIGRSIRDYLKVHYGVSEDSHGESNTGVVRIGADRVNINISDVMSTAESQQGYLGEYGGRGIGYGDNQKYDYTAKEFGVWLTMTTIVPESGYYQGYLAENGHLDRYTFFTPEFDALGYQVLERGEIMADWNADSASHTTPFNPISAIDHTTGFGFVPRYSEYKVGRNIVNGDLSLVGLYNSMSPYTLDRRLPAGAIKAISGVYQITAPDFVPTTVYDNFRRVDPTDHLGQYNRIFNYGGNDLDHFIIHNIFEVDAIAPMKSLTSSFDAQQQGEDSIEVVHS